MLFSSVTFIFYFLPIVFMLYYLVKEKYRNYLLLLASLIFYAWGGLLYLPLILTSIFVNYVFGLKIDKYKYNKNKASRVLLYSVIFNVLFLGVFKYSNFLVDNFNIMFNISINIPQIPLPIGISFYTFQAMSYVIDVYREDGRVQKNIFNLALYISMFPQLVAGPIVRYETVDNQLSYRTYSFQKFNSGLERVVKGLLKKVIIANSMGEMATIIYGLSNMEMSISTAWLGAIAYTLQIYFDFSGYSDMAIGLGKMLGFDFLENFNYPYIAKNVTEFWRRWHISLGSWFRDYVYIPLGGNRCSGLKVYRNLAIVWFVTGIWHGASWNFIIWGVYFGVFIILERLFLKKLLERTPRMLQHFYLMFIVIIGWVIFSQPDLTLVIGYLKVMFGMDNSQFINGYTGFYLKEYMIYIIIAIVGSLPVSGYLKGKFKGYIQWVKPVVTVGAFILVTIYLVNSTFNPFIYFNF